MSDVLADLRTFLVDEVLKGDTSVVLDDDLDLKEAGLLSSLAMMRLVAFVEERFAILVGVSDPRTHFNTLEGIAGYVQAALAQDAV